ncbi:MAG: SIR2 family protein [Proteobacteria bacterium]|nr:SIR2 family protein [Pseudomonadota bacterium]
MKFAVSKRLEGLGPDENGSFGMAALDEEIKALKDINPHAVITTNYDRLLEPIFPEYSAIIGQQVIRHSYMSIGEIFKIHGCVSDPASLVLTNEDYSKFANDKKYLSAKLFAYFVEHPLLFIGYAAGDPNIKAILQEIDHMLPDGQGLIDNIYILQYDENTNEKSYPARDTVVDLGEGKSARIKSITANSFEWVFKAFKSEAPLEKVNVKLLRAISHRVVDMVRKDAAKNVVQINFEMLHHALEHPEDFAKVFGIAAMADPALMNIMYPFSPTQAAKKLGYEDWNYMYQLINKLKETTGYDMRESDNNYHVKIPNGAKAVIRRYSQAAVDLLQKVRDGHPLPDLSNPTVTGEKTEAAPATN